MAGLSNAEKSLLGSEASTGNRFSQDQTNDVFKGTHVVVDVTALSTGAPTITVTVQGKKPQSDSTSSTAYYTLLQSTALGTTGKTVLKVYPGISGTANAAANDVLPHTWRVSSTLASTGAAPSVTHDIGAHLIL